jgi:tetratricopeptide (TPR) repeat protein
MFLAFCVATAAFWLNGSFALAQSTTGSSSAPHLSSTQTARSSGAKSSSSADAALGKAQSLLEKGQLNDAETAVREDLKTNPASANAHFLLGYILFREVQAQALHDDPHPDAIYSAPSQSLVELRNRHAKESLAEYTAGARYQRPSAFDLKIVSLDYILLGDSIDADKWLTLSLKWDPTDSNGWYELGRTKYSENRFKEAIDAFQKCLALDPQNVKAEENLGLSYAGLGDDPQAVSAYQAAIAWQADAANKDPEPYLALGALFLEQNRPKDAIPVALQATQIAPSVSQGHELLGKAYVQANDLPKAQIELEQAVKLSPDMARLHYILGQVYRKEGFAAKAKAEFDRCAALQGTRGSDPTTM